MPTPQDPAVIGHRHVATRRELVREVHQCIIAHRVARTRGGDTGGRARLALLQALRLLEMYDRRQ